LFKKHDIDPERPDHRASLTAGQPTRVGFHQASVECAAPFDIDRIDVRVRSGDTLVFEGSWPVTLSFKE
jgi:hypothetical protein